MMNRPGLDRGIARQRRWRHYHQVHIDNGRSIASVIQARASLQTTSGAQAIVAGAQANYTYQLTQEGKSEPASTPDPAGRSQEGDAAQYVLGKLGLIDIHRQLRGSDVTVAIIDSQIDFPHLMWIA
jgi:hypothetical protein